MPATAKSWIAECIKEMISACIQSNSYLTVTIQYEITINFIKRIMCTLIFETKYGVIYRKRYRGQGKGKEGRKGEEMRKKEKGKEKTRQEYIPSVIWNRHSLANFGQGIKTTN